MLARAGGRLLTPGETIDVFRYKTAPAFEVALKMGACLAGVNSDFFEVLSLYSKEIGIAYQMKDDLDDFDGDRADDIGDLRPSLLVALAARTAPDRTAELVADVRKGLPGSADSLRELIHEHKLPERVIERLDQRRSWALDALRGVQNSAAKALLHRLANRILETTD